MTELRASDDIVYLRNVLSCPWSLAAVACLRDTGRLYTLLSLEELGPAPDTITLELSLLKLVPCPSGE